MGIQPLSPFNQLGEKSKVNKKSNEIIKKKFHYAWMLESNMDQHRNYYFRTRYAGMCVIITGCGAIDAGFGALDTASGAVAQIPAR